MMLVNINLPSERASETLAIRLANCLQFSFIDKSTEDLPSPLILTFSGEIGAGKTTLIRAALRHLGVKSNIKSPTFSLVESYSIPHVELHHFDLYRIQDDAELEDIGFRDYFSGPTICFIEWPERVHHGLEHVDIAFELVLNQPGRNMQMKALSSKGATIVSCLTGEA